MKTLNKGQKFGKLTVLKWDRSNKSWICKCDCGTKTRSRAWALKMGRHISCGCALKEIREKKRLPNSNGIKRAILRNYKRAAKKRGYAFSLKEKDFFNLIIQECYYCGSAPSMEWPYQGYDTGFKYNGIDRKNNAKGYSKGNSVSYCKKCNNSKSTLNISEWKGWLKKVYLNLKKNGKI